MLEVSRKIREFPRDVFKNATWNKRLCIDIDGVICEYDFPKIIKKFFGVDLSPIMIYAFDLADVLGVAPVLIEQIFKEQVYGQPNFVEGAIDTLTQWIARGDEIIIFSNRIKYMEVAELTKWLFKWGIPFTRVATGQGDYDVHIDDLASKLMATNSRLRLLFNRPWNKWCLNITRELVRVNDWQEIREMVDRGNE